jgi:hypothetical protein
MADEVLASMSESHDNDIVLCDQIHESEAVDDQLANVGLAIFGDDAS